MYLVTGSSVLNKIDKIKCIIVVYPDFKNNILISKHVFEMYIIFLTTTTNGRNRLFMKLKVLLTVHKVKTIRTL